MLEGKVAIITGGTRGIGLEIVKLFKKNGASVILFGSKKETVEKAVQKLKMESMEVEGFYPDLSNYAEIEKVVSKIQEKYGHIDILVNNAGISQRGFIEDIKIEDFDKIMELNVKAMFFMTKIITPFHIRVNAVAPGIIDTDMVSNLPKEVIEPLIKTIPLGRIGKTTDIANAFLFLASDMASYISGIVLPVDGLARS